MKLPDAMHAGQEKSVNSPKYEQVTQDIKKAALSQISALK